MYGLISFTRPNQQDDVPFSEHCGLSGEEARRFYQNVLGQCGEEAEKSHVPAERRWCADCEIQHGQSEDTHRSSTVHQFSVPRDTPVPHYCLSPTSTSFQMMVRDGWDPARGLGPTGSGRRQPIPTVLKRDHRGLGYGAVPKARVTHHQARDVQAVRRRERHARTERETTLRRREERIRQQQDRMWERDYRSSFYL